MLKMTSKKIENIWLTTSSTREFIINGVREDRIISKIKIDPSVLKEIFNGVKNVKTPKISFNIMLITTDHKVLLLQRSQSFHYPKVKTDLKTNHLNLKLLESLYSSEMKHLKLQEIEDKNNLIHIFPGGHSLVNETIISTLLRELQEETCLGLKLSDLKFNQSWLFNVLIHDLMIDKYFNNYIFPVKVEVTSHFISKNFKETRHTKNPTFVNIENCDLDEAFTKVQNFMIL